MRAGGPVRHLHQVPHPLARQRHAAHREKSRVASWRAVFPFRAELMRARCGRPSRKYVSSASRRCAPAAQCAPCRPCAHLRVAGIQRKIAGGERRDLRDAQPTCVKQLHNCTVSERRGKSLRMRCGHAGPLQHLHHFRLGQRFRQYLPSLGRFNIHGWVVMDAAIQQQPLVKTAQAAQLARR